MLQSRYLNQKIEHCPVPASFPIKALLKGCIVCVLKNKYKFIAHTAHFSASTAANPFSTLLRKLRSVRILFTLETFRRTNSWCALVKFERGRFNF